MLEVVDVSKSFGGLAAVQHCSFTVAEGTITGLIGPNGAGKSTMLNMVAGEMAPDSGTVSYRGQRVDGGPPHRLARLGVYRTFQLARELGSLTVMENVLLARSGHPGENIIRAILRPRAVKETERSLEVRARDILRKMGLYEQRNILAGNLSGGQKKLLELARAVMADAELLLMDEPMAGVNPALRDQLIGHIRAAHQEGLTVLLVEHNLSVIDELCDDVIVMAAGTVLTRGRMSELRKDRTVVEAYLGGAPVDVNA